MQMDSALWAYALLVGIVYLWWAMTAGTRPRSGDTSQGRVQRADDARERRSALARYIVAGVGFSTAGALVAHAVPPAVAYAILCLALAGRVVADQISEERAPGRRSALLRRSRRVDPVLLTWIGLAAASPLLLIPWIQDERDRAVAIVVVACVAAMVLVAWRIASAPPLLFGNDLEAEQVVDSETRAIRTGNTCIVTFAPVIFFIGFVGGSSSSAHNSSGLFLALLMLWAGLFVWKVIYTRHLSRAPLAS